MKEIVFAEKRSLKPLFNYQIAQKRTEREEAYEVMKD
jgi:hypothetical protein